MRCALVMSLLAGMLCGCGGEDTLDGSSERAMDASIERIKKSMTPERRKEFEDAMQTIGEKRINLLVLLSKPDQAWPQYRDLFAGKTAQQIIEEARKLKSQKEADSKAESERGAKALESYIPATAPVQQNGIELTLDSVEVGPVELEDTWGERLFPSKGAVLAIRLHFTNRSESRKIDYRSWQGVASLDGAKLRDDVGNTYEKVEPSPSSRERPTGHTHKASVYPMQSISDVIVFQPPVEKAKSLYLELPEEHIGGGEGAIKLRIPREMIRPAKPVLVSHKTTPAELLITARFLREGPNGGGGTQLVFELTNATNKQIKSAKGAIHLYDEKYDGKGGLRVELKEPLLAGKSVECSGTWWPLERDFLEVLRSGKGHLWFRVTEITYADGTTVEP